MQWTAFVMGTEETITTLSETFERVDESDTFTRAARFKIDNPASLFETIETENIVIRGIRMRQVKQRGRINRT